MLEGTTAAPFASVTLPASPEARREEFRESLECEMCGAPVVAHHCKRICLKCGFMTGCSEGI